MLFSFYLIEDNAEELSIVEQDQKLQVLTFVSPLVCPASRPAKAEHLPLDAITTQQATRRLP